MNGDPDFPDARAASPKRPLLTWLLLPGLFFVLGIAAMGWLLTRWDEGARMIGVAAAPAAVPAPVAAPAAAEPEPPAATGQQAVEPAPEPERKIGRASCRERGQNSGAG